MGQPETRPYLFLKNKIYFVRSIAAPRPAKLAPLVVSTLDAAFGRSVPPQPHRTMWSAPCPHSPFEAKIAFLLPAGRAWERRRPTGWGALWATGPGTGSPSAGMGCLVPRKARLVYEIGPAPRPTGYFGAGRRPKTPLCPISSFSPRDVIGRTVRACSNCTGLHKIFCGGNARHCKNLSFTAEIRPLHNHTSSIGNVNLSNVRL